VAIAALNEGTVCSSEAMPSFIHNSMRGNTIVTYTISQAAKLLGVCDATIRRLIWSHKITFRKIGRVYRLSDNDIDYYLKASNFRNTLNDTDKNQPSKTNNLNPEEILAEVTTEIAGLTHGIVQLSLYIQNGILSKYTITKEKQFLNEDISSKKEKG
jgi:excisionase family DNA binding protein